MAVIVSLVYPRLTHADIFGICPGFGASGIGDGRISTNATNIEIGIDWDATPRNFFGVIINPNEIGTMTLSANISGGEFPFPISGTLVSQDGINGDSGPPFIATQFSGVFSATQAEMRSGNQFGFVWPITNFVANLPETLPTDITYVIDGIGQCIADCESAAPMFYISLVINGFQATTTPIGSGPQTSTTVTATFYDINTQTTQSQTIGIEFTSVDTAGSTTVSASANSTASFSFGFQALPNPLFLDIVTQATVTFPARVCVTYIDDNNDGIVDNTSTSVNDLRLLHSEAGIFVDRTVLPIDTVNKQACAEVMSFSEFVLAQAIPIPTPTPTSAPTPTPTPIPQVAVAGKRLILVTKTDRPNTLRMALELPIDTLPCLSEGSSCDPTLFGATVEISSSSYPMPASHWRRIDESDANNDYAYSDLTLAQGPIANGNIRNGILRLQGRGAGLTHTLDSNPAPVHAALLLPQLKLCTQFGGTTAFKANTRFTARNAPIPPACIQ